MEIFIDSADLAEIAKWVDYGVIDGVTTNPSILLSDGAYDMVGRVREIAALVAPRPVSVEVTTNDLDEMLSQAQTFARWAANIVVKIPIITPDGAPCLGVIRRLKEQGIRVNATACLSLGQVMLAAKAGASYASIFAGRVSDEGHDASRLIGQAAQWLREGGYDSRLIVGSIREVINIQEAAVAGAHIITIPPPFLARMIDHKYTRDTVRGFVADAQKALAELEQRARGIP